MNASRPVSVYALAKGGYSEEDSLKFCAEAFDEARTDKWRVFGVEHCELNRLTAMYYGKDQIDESPYRKRPRENQVNKITEAIRAPLLDHRPDPEIIARDPDTDLKSADIYNASLNYSLEASDYEQGYHGFVDNLLLQATGIFKIWWDASKKLVRYSPHDVRLFFLPPGTTNLQEAPYVISVGMSDVDSVIARYPKRAEEILSGLKSYSERGVKSGWFGSIVNFFYRTKQNAIQSAGGTEGPGEPMNTSRKIEVVEVYARIPDDAALAAVDLRENTSEAERAEIGDERIPAESAPAMVESNGRPPSRIRLMVVIGGTIVARNGWMPYKHNRYPFVTSQSRFVSGRIWGASDYEFGIDSLQQALNRYVAREDAYNAKSQWPYLKKMHTLPDEMFSQNPDAMISVKSREEYESIGYVVPPPAGEHVHRTKQEMKQEMAEESGTFSISQDVLKRDIAARTLSQIREASETPVRMKLRLMQPAFKELALQTVSLMLQYSTRDFIARIVGDNPYQPKRIKVSRKDLDAVMDLDTLKFDVRFGISTVASLSRAERFNQWTEAISGGALNPEYPIEVRAALLQAVDFPGWRSMIEGERKAREAAELEKKRAAEAPPLRSPAVIGPTGSAAPEALPEGVSPDEVGQIEAQLAAMMGGGAPAPSPVGGVA